MQTSWFKNITKKIVSDQVSIAPLVTFRILFGSILLLGTIRFMLSGWVEKLYLEPKFFFKFYGFEWINPLDQTGMYILMALIIASAAFVMLGLFYRIASIILFLSFTYLELIDATNYLNHYYLVILLAFLMIFLPANRNFSLDVWRNPSLKVTLVPAWTINVLILQLTIVYTFAGIAKLNEDWLLRAMPLAIWLPEHKDVPLIGYLFNFKWTAFAFSWMGAFYDLTIAYFLLFKKTRIWAYCTVIIFHTLTGILFNIGLFPVIMIFSTLIFFPAAFHEKWLTKLAYKNNSTILLNDKQHYFNFLKPLLGVYFVLQILLPIRHVFYPGNILWTEEAYRFSWRVMLVEKSGHTVFTIEDKAQNKKTEIINGKYLTQFQEKQMSIQPDFILQFAHFLKKEYETKHGLKDPVITVDAHVALNGRTSQRLIDPSVNLAEIHDSFAPKQWLLPFEK